MLPPPPVCGFSVQLELQEPVGPFLEPAPTTSENLHSEAGHTPLSHSSLPFTTPSPQTGPPAVPVVLSTAGRGALAKQLFGLLSSVCSCSRASVSSSRQAKLREAHILSDVVLRAGRPLREALERARAAAARGLQPNCISSMQAAVSSSP